MRTQTPLREVILRHKTALQEKQGEIKTCFLQDGDVLNALAARSALIDDILSTLLDELDLQNEVTFCAVGGYGRGELWPGSDIDLLILLPCAPGNELGSRLEQLVSVFWDIGLEIGHSVRTVEECLEEAANDLTVQTALVEARHLAGDRWLFDKMRSAFMARLDPQSFFHAKRIEQDERYLRYQESPYSLEPNCKESPGGLRDLQSILWIAQAAGYGSSWSDLHLHGLITERESLGLARRDLFLKRLRLHLHLQAGRREDRLLFDHQTALAEKLGFEATPERRASERLMQEYYRTAKAIMQLNTILLQNLGAAIFPAPDLPPEPISASFQNSHQLLDVVHENVFSENPQCIFEAFLLMQAHDELKGMTARTIRALWRARLLVNESFREDPVNQGNFVRLFKAPRGVLHEMRRLNQFEILGNYLPNFGAIVGQMQHDLFHIYTVDQHILRVLRNLRRFSETEFSHEYPFCSQLICYFEKPWVLYVAALFHDIAKGRGGSHSELGAIDASEFCTRHAIDTEDAELISWLVLHHLTMSTVAQKKDISDPDVIADFAAVVGDERHLTALYLLTVADIRATSPKVWNGWKGQLLESLYHQTLRQFNSGGATPKRQGIIQEHQEEAIRLLRYHAIPDNAQNEFWQQLDTAYFVRHGSEEIAWHARALHYRTAPDTPVVKARLNRNGEGIEVMVYTLDQRDLFARMAGFFSRAGYSIMDAKIHTTRHGYALDSFMLLDLSGRESDRDMISYIEHELTDRLVRQGEPEAPATGRLSRQVRHFPIQPQVTIQADEKDQNYVLSVSAADRPGLLYTVAMTLAAHGANLQTAKIATLGERVEDTFLISGGDLKESACRIRLETELIERLQC